MPFYLSMLNDKLFEKINFLGLARFKIFKE